jgi:hypothetical protein
MANIKFSDFTVGNTEGDIDFVVGYKGANNIQISPTNLLASALGNYLPLAGGTMTGDLKLNDNVVAKFGTGDDLRIQHSSSGGGAGYIQNYTGDLQIQNRAADKDILFRADDGAGVVTTYFYLDGSAGGSLPFTVFPDSSTLTFGTGYDLRQYHNGTDSYLDNYEGNLNIRNYADNKDIVFQCDNGSGGLAEYFRLDGSQVETVVFKDFNFEDNVKANFGSSADLKIYHNSTNSIIENITGDLILQNNVDDRDIIFKSDDGSGGIAPYFLLDGSISSGGNLFTRFPDNSRAVFGTGSDLQIHHNGTNSLIENSTGDFYISNKHDDGDIIFFSDDGSGGTTEYFRLDGSRASGAYTYTTRPDGGVITFGDGLDLRLWHDPNTNESYMRSYNNNLYIESVTADKDILFRADDGSGGTDTYFYLDGGGVLTRFDKRLRMSDAVSLQLGSSGNFEMYHVTGNTTMDNFTGNLTIRNSANDKDISFACDDGSGGNAEYFRVDGGSVLTFFSKPIQIADNQNIFVGDSGDLQIYHDGSNSYIKDTGTGSLKILAQDFDLSVAANNASMIRAIDGAQVELYYGGTKKLETTSTGIDVSGQVSVNDYLVHNGDTNTYLGYNGADSFELVVGGTQKITADANAVYLRYQGAAKLETKSTGIKITGVSEYADNTAALAGGLTTGEVYRTGDLLKIVH